MSLFFLHWQVWINSLGLGEAYMSHWSSSAFVQKTKMLTFYQFTLCNKLQCILNQNTFSVQKMHLKMSSDVCAPFYLCVVKLTYNRSFPCSSSRVYDACTSHWISQNWLWYIWDQPRLLHGLSLVDVGLSVGDETRPPIGWHRPYVIGWFKYRLDFLGRNES